MLTSPCSRTSLWTVSLIGTLFITGCDQRASESPASGGQDTSKYFATTEERKLLESKFPLTAVVTQCELDKIVPEFDNRVYRNANGTEKLIRPTCKIKLGKSFQPDLGTLRNVISMQGNPNGTSLLMLIHYGLNANYELVYGIGFTAVNLVTLEFPRPTRYYMVDPNTQLLEEWPDTTVWMNTFGKLYKSSTTNVFFRREPAGVAPHSPFDLKIDNQFVLFDMLKLSQFLNDNQLQSPKGSEMDIVELVSYAHVRENGKYYHGVALVPWHDLTRTVGNGEGTSFVMRAMNLGSPCPDNCKKWSSSFTAPPVAGCPPEDLSEEK